MLDLILSGGHVALDYEVYLQSISIFCTLLLHNSPENELVKTIIMQNNPLHEVAKIRTCDYFMLPSGLHVFFVCLQSQQVSGMPKTVIRIMLRPGAVLLQKSVIFVIMFY